MWLHLSSLTIQKLALPLCCQLFWLRCLCCIMFQFWLLNFEYLVSLWQRDPDWQEITGGADVERVLHCGLTLWGLSTSNWPLLWFHLQRCWVPLSSSNPVWFGLSPGSCFSALGTGSGVLGPLPYTVSRIWFPTRSPEPVLSLTSEVGEIHSQGSLKKQCVSVWSWCVNNEALRSTQAHPCLLCI